MRKMIFKILKKGVDKSRNIWYSINCSRETSTNKALWCSRLARQPVTLEVDGSSPFGVAKAPLLRGKGAFLLKFHSV